MLLHRYLATSGMKVAAVLEVADIAVICTSISFVVRLVVSRRKVWWTLRVYLLVSGWVS